MNNLSSYFKGNYKNLSKSETHKEVSTGFLSWYYDNCKDMKIEDAIKIHWRNYISKVKKMEIFNLKYMPCHSVTGKCECC